MSTREEIFIEKLTDPTTATPTPVTNKEKLLDQLGSVVLPPVTTDDNGKIAKVVNGKWVIGDDNDTQFSLPAVTSEDAGCVLMVDAEGHWVKGTLGDS